MIFICCLSGLMERIAASVALRTEYSLADIWFQRLLFGGDTFEALKTFAVCTDRLPAVGR